MAALPYMPLYVADYLADTSHLTALEHGAYLILIMNYWQRGKPLPADDAKLRIIARIDEDQWATVWGSLRDFFVEADGVIHHARIDAELEKVRSKSDKARAAGKQSASVRATSVEQAFNHTDTHTDTENRKPLSVSEPRGQEHCFSDKEVCLFVEQCPHLDVPKQLTDLAAWCDKRKIWGVAERRTAIRKRLLAKQAEAESVKTIAAKSTGPPIPISGGLAARYRQRSA